MGEKNVRSSITTVQFGKATKFKTIYLAPYSGFGGLIKRVYFRLFLTKTALSVSQPSRKGELADVEVRAEPVGLRQRRGRRQTSPGAQGPLPRPANWKPENDSS